MSHFNLKIHGLQFSEIFLLLFNNIHLFFLIDNCFFFLIYFQNALLFHYLKFYFN